MPAHAQPARLHIWATERVAHASEAVALGQEWKGVLDEPGADIREARNIAYLVVASLSRVLADRGTWRDPLTSERLKSENADLHARLVKLADVAQATRNVARPADPANPPAELWDLFGDLAQVVAAVEEVINGPRHVRDEATEARDRFIYDEWRKGTPEKKIRAHVNSQSGWDPIEKRQGISQAAERYAKRHRLTSPAKRKPGRPRKQKP
jgi:hypothetical protein